MPANKDADTGASEATMHDDRAYTLSMLGWFLQEKRLEHIRNKKRDIPSNMEDYFKIITPTKPHSYFN